MDFKKLILLTALIILLIPTNCTSTYSKNNALQVLNNSVNKENLHKSQEKNNKNTSSSQATLPSSKPKVNSEDKQQNNSIKKQPSRGVGAINELDITLTFYTGLPEENGGYKEITCTGKNLKSGMVANNVLPLGTKIFTNEFGTLTVSDRGGNNFDTIHRLDVYVPRVEDESDPTYLKRVNDMGIVTVKAYIVQS